MSTRVHWDLKVCVIEGTPGMALPMVDTFGTDFGSCFTFMRFVAVPPMLSMEAIRFVGKFLRSIIEGGLYSKSTVTSF